MGIHNVFNLNAMLDGGYDIIVIVSFCISITSRQNVTASNFIYKLIKFFNK